MAAVRVGGLAVDTHPARAQCHINRLIEPSSGEVLIEGQAISGLSPEALREAAEFAQNDKGAAADTYIRVTHSKVDRAELLKIIDNPQFEFSITPKNTYPLADFMYRVGAIKNKPESWKDYFFQDAKPLQGS